MDVVGTLRRYALFGWQLQVIDHMNALDNEDVALFFDFADRVRPVCLEVGRDFARLKGAAKCASQSASGSGYHVVERAGMDR